MSKRRFWQVLKVALSGSTLYGGCFFFSFDSAAGLSDIFTK